jgi:ubiquinone biosynthesis accessory factor UbiJ
MNELLLKSCEHWLNRCVAESSAARAALAALDGRSLTIELQGFSLSLRLLAHDEALVLGRGAREVSSATLRGTPLELLRLLGRDRERTMAGRFRDSGAQLTGSIDVAESFGEALRLARPDLEEALARWIGDLPAHRIGRAGRGLVDWTLASAAAVERDVADYLKEESRMLPTRPEARAHARAVERLRDDIERLEARIVRLRRRRTAS